MKRLMSLLTAGILACAVSSVSVAQETDVTNEAAIVVDDNSVETTVVESAEVPEAPADDPQDEARSRTEDETKEQSVVLEIHSSTVSQSEDGEKPSVKVRGRVVVIGPDGKKSEYDLSDDQVQGFRVKIEEGADVAKELDRIIIMDKKNTETEAVEDEVNSPDGEWVEERFVIGVQCEEAGELLRVHLRLGDKGVAILDVREGTPAAEGGLQKHDIIVSIAGHDVESREDLTAVVLESEGKPLELSIIRSGEPQVISVTPKKMKVPVVMAPAAADVEHLKELAGSAKGGVRLHLIHPGVMLDGVLPQDHEAINKMIEQLRKSAGEEAARALEQARDAREKSQPLRQGQVIDHDQLRQNLKTLQEQMRDLQQQMTELQQQLKSNDQPE